MLTKNLITVNMNKGVNEVLVMMRYAGAGWNAMVRFNDPKGLLRNDY